MKEQNVNVNHEPINSSLANAPPRSLCSFRREKKESGWRGGERVRRERKHRVVRSWWG